MVACSYISEGTIRILALVWDIFVCLILT